MQEPAVGKVDRLYVAKSNAFFIFRRNLTAYSECPQQLNRPSPRIPLVADNKQRYYWAIWAQKKRYTYESADVDPVWVYFTARRTLHFERVVIWIFGGILRTDISDPIHPDVLVIHTSSSSNALKSRSNQNPRGKNAARWWCFWYGGATPRGWVWRPNTPLLPLPGI